MKHAPFIDLHEHILWGLDDGPRTQEEMYAMLRLAAEDGIGLIAATPHAYPAIKPFDSQLYMQRLDEANAYCKAQGLPLQLVCGCEIRYSDNTADLLSAGRLFSLGGTRYVLIEFSYDVTQDDIGRAVDRLFNAGYHVIVAHVERCRCLAHSWRRAIDAKREYSLLYQMNCDTVLHPYGMHEGHFVQHMLQERAIDLLASDAHNTTERRVCLSRAWDAVSYCTDSEYADRLLGFGRDKMKGKMQ